MGVGAYTKHAKLGNTVRDAEAVYHAVNACAGCRAAIIRDPPDKKTIRTHLRAFLEELAPTGANGAPPETVLLFVAGHGVQRGHHVYLIPTAAASDDVPRRNRALVAAAAAANRISHSSWPFAPARRYRTRVACTMSDQRLEKPPTPRVDLRNQRN